MKALVTGGTGFIGGNVVRALLRHGYEVKVLLRRESSLLALEGQHVELSFGDLTDRASLEEALKGCQVLFHVGAIYSLWTPDPEQIYQVNVQGTRTLFEAALAQGIEKAIFTSSESTIGMPESGGLGNEGYQARLENLPGHYKKSKYLAEIEAFSFCEEGLPVVVVNPTTPVGIADVKPTPTGQIVLNFLKRRMPAYVDTGLNLIDVEDVAEGHVLALEKGRPCERYILGNRNLTLKELLGILAELTGRKAPVRRVPFWLATAAAFTDEWFSGHITHSPPGVPLAGVMAAHKFRYMDASKAIRELGLPQNPVEEALRKAINWFQEHGYVGERIDTHPAVDAA